MKRKNGSIINTHNTVKPIHKDLGWKAGVVSIVSTRKITTGK
ncbi:MAG: hypothetical protein ACLFR1_09765 [Spirochaetia bacterium]